MMSLSNLKKLAALLLMICFVLPLSRCDRNAKIALPDHAASGSPKATVKRPAVPDYEEKFAYQNVAKDDLAGSALTLAAFFWPLFLIAFGGVAFGSRAATVINLFEMVLCAGSAYMIYGITLFGELRYGGYLAFVAVGVYSVASLAQILMRFRAPGRSTT
ncbi:hypothetical protein BH11PSE11_BH11PSE11_28110 [soil metagenome]